MNEHNLFFCKNFFHNLRKVSTYIKKSYSRNIFLQNIFADGMIYKNELTLFVISFLFFEPIGIEKAPNDGCLLCNSSTNVFKIFEIFYNLLKPRRVTKPMEAAIIISVTLKYKRKTKYQSKNKNLK